MTRASNHPFVSRLASALVGLTAVTLIVAACEPIPPRVLTPAPPSTLFVAPTTMANGDIGWEGPSFSGASGSPSGSKPESKLWFNDGSWWADMWDTASGDFYVHKLNLSTGTWARTPTRLDDRSNSRSDAMWNGTHLYVASHAFSEGSSSTASAPSFLRRFSYQPNTDSYTLDPGFPVQINAARSETLVIDQDSQGRLWATWTEDLQVMVAVSSVGGASWGVPFALPVSGSRVTSDDIASVVSFGGNRIGILWSNQGDGTMYFASRLDGDATGTWSGPEVAYRGTSAADDHINLKNVVDQNGRILAAVKTSMSGSSPLVHLLDRSPSGSWSSHVYGLGTDSHTRPIVVIDREHAQVQMFATSGQSGGSIYRKTAPLSAPSFVTGKGTMVLDDVDSADINNATSTKQAVDSTSGLVVLATNDSTRRYWTHYDPLDGGTPPDTTTTSTTSTTTTTTTTTTTPPIGTPVTFAPVADARVKSTSPTRNYGTTLELRTRFGVPEHRSYLRFSPTGLSGQPTRAILRLYVTDASRAAGIVGTTTSTWGETTVTFANSPAPLAQAVASIGAVTKGTWAEIDVTSAVVGNGNVSFVLTGTGTDSALFTSRQTSTAPQLVIMPEALP